MADLMLAYHSGALEGSPANAATDPTCRLIVVSTCTSTLMTTILADCAGTPTISAVRQHRI